MVSDKWFQTLPPNYKQIVISSAREAIKMSHGFATLAAVQGWNASCKNFKECHILPAAEKAKMAAIARPAWKTWITQDFGIDAKLVDDLWAEIDRIDAELKRSDMMRYGG